jgi:hypothetical protein
MFDNLNPVELAWYQRVPSFTDVIKHAVQMIIATRNEQHLLILVNKLEL